MNGIPVWLEFEPEPLYAVLHAPTASHPRRAPVLFVAPYGWDEMCSYRARRAWAIACAQAGFTALRIDLPGSGHSVGVPLADGRFDSWIRAVAEAAGWLSRYTGFECVTAIGIGLGGMLALQAASAGAPIADMVLWGVPARGRTYLRMLRTYAAVVEAALPDDFTGREPRAGVIEATGYAMSTDTATALAQIDLTDLPLPGAEQRRVLMIARDGLGVDKRLRQFLEGLGASVTVIPATDYEILIAHPQHGGCPRESIAHSIQWLACGAVGSAASDGASFDRTAIVRSITFEHHGREISESLLGWDFDHGKLAAILSEPADGGRAPFCILLANSGALRCVGPSRMWVELTRRWAARGVPAVRMDFEGLGDSDGDGDKYADNAELHAPRMAELELDVIARLVASGVSDSFVVIGLCSGAYTALRTALRDSRVVGAVLINLYAFEWNRRLVAERDRRKSMLVMREGFISWVRRRGLSFEDFRRAARAFRPSARSGRGVSEEDAQLQLITDSLDKLMERGTQIRLLLSQSEPLADQLARLPDIDRWTNLRVEPLPSHDHDLHALWLQELTHARLDRALQDLLSSHAAR
ncbi:MAG: alpha/beta fold hydrolase [Solirubrobacteraceae bacterium]